MSCSVIVEITAISNLKVVNVLGTVLKTVSALRQEENVTLTYAKIATMTLADTVKIMNV